MGKGFSAGRYTIDAGGISRFYLNRLLRIYPVYVIAIMIVCVLKSPGLLTVANGYHLLRAFAFSAEETNVYIPIGSLWSISTEFQFYLLAPFLHIAIVHLKRFVRLDVFILSVLLIGGFLRYYAMQQLSWIWIFSVYKPLVWNLDLFASGMALSQLVNDRRTSSSRIFDVPPLFILAAFPIFYICIAHSGATSVFRDLEWPSYMSIWPFLAAIFTCVVVFLFEEGGRLGIQRSGPAQVIIRSTQGLGILTFCIYVLQEPILLALRSNYGSVLRLHETWLMFIPTMIFYVLFAACAYLLIERPFERMKV